MSERASELDGKIVLVVEDSFVVSMQLEDQLRQLGAVVLGPFATQDQARAALASRPADLAVLDVNVRGGTTIALARELEASGVPCVFATGYSTVPDLPAELAHVPKIDKPYEVGQLRRALASRLPKTLP